MAKSSPRDILLVEDNPGDVVLTREILGDSLEPGRIHVAVDGVEALAFLRREGMYADAPRPDFVLLDLNLPRLDGRQLLRAIRDDPELQQIPVVVLTSSDAESDVAQSYALGASCYIKKAADAGRLAAVVRTIEAFWSSVCDRPLE